jgi:hypothetical protein
VHEKWRQDLEAPPPLFGRINLNTAPAAVIASLPGVEPELAHRIAEVRSHWAEGDDESLDPRRRTGVTSLSMKKVRGEKSWWQPISPENQPRWNNFSDFILDEDVWYDKTVAERINLSFLFSQALTFNSLSYKVITENIAEPPPAGDVKRKSTTMVTERIIAGDRGRAETVTFHFGQKSGFGKRDRDIRYADGGERIRDYSEGIIENAMREARSLARRDSEN